MTDLITAEIIPLPGRDQETLDKLGFSYVVDKIENNKVIYTFEFDHPEFISFGESSNYDVL